jgi:CheY-like chemotaxis protein
MSRTILVIEDDNDVRVLYETALQSRGYEVIAAQSSSEAFAVLDQPGFAPGLAIIDITMPDTPGTKAIEYMRGDERYQHIPIIVITANEGYGDQLDGQVDRFFVKPIELREILATVEQLALT